MKHLHIAVLFAVSFLFLSCSDELPVGHALRGDIWGDVEMYDYDGFLMNDRSGVSITLEGTDFSTLSNASGEWRLKNIPAGVYNIVFRKEGFTWTKEQIQFVGNGAYYIGSYTLAGIPTYRILDFSATAMQDNSNSVLFAGVTSDMPGPGIDRKAIIFWSTDSVKVEKRNENYVGWMQRYANDTIIGRVYYSDFYEVGVRAGSVIYMKAYPTSSAPYTFNFHSTHLLPDHCIACSDSGSPIVRFVVP